MKLRLTLARHCSDCDGTGNVTQGLTQRLCLTCGGTGRR
ncbi:hypothetical protein LI90_3801 [Carbonactinospora thermoautotrophica]|uniref:Chaperone protein DnaJ n=1 Tax=Carbonactinospora thermoautotrophica TaxID=1469144 RepID=A0A132MXW8_9ACTN|nr:hypothetical protein LI90_3801 [Carbonactinospora thermoautotrophica]